MLMFATWQGRITLSHKLWRVSLFSFSVLRADVISAKCQQKNWLHDRWRESEREREREGDGFWLSN